MLIHSMFIQTINVDIKEIEYNKESKKLFINDYNDKNTPLYMKNKDKKYWFEYLKDKNTLYFKYNSCSEMKEKLFIEEVKNFQLPNTKMKVRYSTN